MKLFDLKACNELAVSSSHVTFEVMDGTNVERTHKLCCFGCQLLEILIKGA